MNNDKGWPSKNIFWGKHDTMKTLYNIMKIYEADTGQINSRNRLTLDKETSTNPSVLFYMICILQPESFFLTCRS